ncbi:MAG: hypothetical protein ACTHQQ_17145, partial [Solirubrobacteraceae bacterium]
GGLLYSLTQPPVACRFAFTIRIAVAPARRERPHRVGVRLRSSLEKAQGAPIQGLGLCTRSGGAIPALARAICGGGGQRRRPGGNERCDSTAGRLRVAALSEPATERRGRLHEAGVQFL